MSKRLVIGLGLPLGLAACAPMMVWEKPGATPADFTQQSAQCQLTAEGMNPDQGVEPIYTGKVGRDIAVNAAAGLLHGIAQGAAVHRTYTLCMEAAGYVGHPAGEGAAPMVAATPVPVAA